MTSFAARERAALCDLALDVGPDAPTLCGDWTVEQLLAHLIVRESDPLGAPGIVLKPLAPLTERAMARTEQRPFGELVTAVRRPALLSPSRLAPLDAVVNMVEFFVHHEDIRRAQPGVVRRSLTAGEEAALWRFVRLAGRGLAMRAGVGVTAERSDTPGSAVLRGGEDGVVVRGRPSEIVLFLYGRKDVADVELEGSDGAVATLRAAKLGV